LQPAPDRTEFVYDKSRVLSMKKMMLSGQRITLFNDSLAGIRVVKM
jgi:hypothetical protein